MNDFLRSAQSPGELADPRAWLAERQRAYHYDVTIVPLDELPRWQLGDDLAHDTRRFFTIEGISIETNFGRVPKWSQPIIMQPEIGILGFLAQRRGGVLHVLAQAKMEPGNHVMVQYSPTVQATPSNYGRVHGGRATPFLEHFLGDTRGRVLVDQLQSEQGSRYFHKRNRNMIVELPEGQAVDTGGDFAWLSLDQVRELLAAGNHLNMNARSVLSSVRYAGTPADVTAADPWRRAVLESHLAEAADDDALARLYAWLADVKTVTRIDVRRVKLSELDGWISDRQSIRHRSGKFFQIVGVRVQAESREVGAWSQPMFAPCHHGHIMMLCQRRDGVLHVLVQARAEPGFLDGVELGATVQFTRANYAGDLPPFAEYLDCPKDWVRVSALQSEDGGRFYHDDTTNVVIELPESERLELPPNFRWVTIGLLKRLASRGYYVDIEARSLLACLG